MDHYKLMEAMGAWTFVKTGCTAAAQGCAAVSDLNAHWIRSLHFITTEIHIRYSKTNPNTLAECINVVTSRGKEKHVTFTTHFAPNLNGWMKVFPVLHSIFYIISDSCHGLYHTFRLHDPTFRTILIKTLFKLFPRYEIIESYFCAQVSHNEGVLGSWK
jgi:hypothetical protein